jgi:hypothetical protein
MPSGGRGAVLYDDGEMIRDARSFHIPTQHANNNYSDQYAMSHRNGSKY